MTAERIGQSGSEQVTTSAPRTEVVPDVRVDEACACASGPWCSPGPVQPSSPAVSQIATALAPRMASRCRPALSAASGVRPSLRWREASDAVCSVW